MSETRIGADGLVELTHDEALSWDVSEALYRDDLEEAFRLVLAELAATRTALAKLAAITGAGGG